VNTELTCSGWKRGAESNQRLPLYTCFEFSVGKEEASFVSFYRDIPCDSIASIVTSFSAKPAAGGIMRKGN